MVEGDSRVRVSVVIPAFNEEAHIGRVVASVREAFRLCGEERFEVVVCDNNSTDRTGKLAGEAGARVVFEPHNQIARARNTGAEAAMGEWLIFIDADSVLSEELLRETLRRMESGRFGGGGAGVEYEREDLSWYVKAGVETWNRISRMMNWAAGSYVFCRKEAWADTGGFSEKHYAGEEIPFSMALKKWCRKRKLRFQVIRKPKLRTSARKVESYSAWRLLRIVLVLALPGALGRREKCDYWYKRE